MKTLEFKQANHYADEKCLLLFLFFFYGFFVITDFMQKSKKWKQMEKQMFNNALIEWKYHCIYAANNVITSSFGMGEGF